jgi:hypothetical protein
VTPGDDDALRRRFLAMRDVDRSAAPPFHDVLRRAAAPRAVRSAAFPAPFAALAGGVGVALAAALLVAHLAGERSAERARAQRVAIARWQAPTDVLLYAAGPEMLGPASAPTRSALDGLLTPPDDE